MLFVYSFIKGLFSVFCVSVLIAPGVARAIDQVIDFEEFPIPLDSYQDWEDGDFTSKGIFFDIEGTDPRKPYDEGNFLNGEVTFDFGEGPEPVAFNDSIWFFLHGVLYDDSWLVPTLTLTRDGGGTFDLYQLDITESLKSAGATEVMIEGNLNGGGYLTEPFELDWVVDGVGGEEDFETIVFIDWVDLDSVVIYALDGVDEKEWGIDNIHVPEPSIALLQSFALACLATLTRWRPFTSGNNPYHK
jgi:hypothetical protein